MESNVPRIGDLLVRNGTLSIKQVNVILEHQQRRRRPFGELAERLFDVDPQAVFDAWVQQYLCYPTRIDLDRQPIDRRVIGLLTRRQAWQLQLMPLCREEGVLLIATTLPRLAATINFAWRHFDEPILVCIAPAHQLTAHLQRWYPWPAMESEQPAMVIRRADAAAYGAAS